jgi:hypothetical protein
VYNKLFSKILDSSIWLEPTPTRIVWLTCLAAMDDDGFCAFASVANLAYRARVSEAEASAAVAALEAPDANSCDPSNDGRRMERVPGGWYVLNAGKYREIVSREESKRLTRERSQRYRERQATVTPRHAPSRSVTARHESVTQSDTDTYTEEQDQDHRADARNAHKVLVKLAHLALSEQPGDAKNHLKDLCGWFKVPYDAIAVSKALDVAEAQKARGVA